MMPIINVLNNSFYTFASHFYDPDTFSTYLPFLANAKDTGVKHFKLAKVEYKKGNKYNGIYNLGLALHYFTDLTQPMHAGNFTAINYPLRYHNKYENYVDTLKETAKVTKGGILILSSRNDPAYWLISNAKRSKSVLPMIKSKKIEAYYIKALFSNYYASLWREKVRSTTKEQLIYAQKATAGYINLWLNSVK